MDRKSKSELIARLKSEGYRPITGLRGHFINQFGNVVHSDTGNALKRLIKGRDLIRIENKTYSVPKLMLSTFRGESYRKQKRIAYIDGNRDNMTLQNIRYAVPEINLPETVINDEDFVKAIRCYIQVRKRYNRMDNIATQIYLQCITENRYFFRDYAKAPYIDVFQAYLSGFRMCMASTAKEKQLTVQSCSKIVRWYLNVLIQDIQKDVTNGLLSVLPYEPRKKTVAQVLKEYNESNKALGLPPLKLPKKKKQSNQEMLDNFHVFLKELRTDTDKSV